MKIEESKIVIKNNKTQKFIALDSASGGYPYDVDIFRAHYWKSHKEAREYADTFSDQDFWVCEVKFDIQVTNINKYDQYEPPRT